MSATVESVPTGQRPASWREELGTANETVQVRLRHLITEDEPEEIL